MTRIANGFPRSPARDDVMAVLRDVWANYRDESFISQFLEPASDAAACGLFQLCDDPSYEEGIKVGVDPR